MQKKARKSSKTLKLMCAATAEEAAQLMLAKPNHKTIVVDDESGCWFDPVSGELIEMAKGVVPLPKTYCCSECGTVVPGDEVTAADCPHHPFAIIVEKKS